MKKKLLTKQHTCIQIHVKIQSENECIECDVSNDKFGLS